MLKPSFQFDPSASFTMLQMVNDGTAGAQFVDTPVTPAGVNRMFFAGRLYHTDAAATHILEMYLRSPEGQAFGLPTHNNALALAANVNAMVLEPFFCPPGWVIRCQSVDAIAGAAFVRTRFLYLDYLIRTL